MNGVNRECEQCESWIFAVDAGKQCVGVSVSMWKWLWYPPTSVRTRGSISLRKRCILAMLARYGMRVCKAWTPFPFCDATSKVQKVLWDLGRISNWAAKGVASPLLPKSRLSSEWGEFLWAFWGFRLRVRSALPAEDLFSQRRQVCGNRGGGRCRFSLDFEGMKRCRCRHLPSEM